MATFLEIAQALVDAGYVSGAAFEAAAEESLAATLAFGNDDVWLYQLT